MKDNVVPLFPHVMRDIEKIVERQENLVQFTKNITELAKRNWRQYRGEDTVNTVFNDPSWPFSLSPSPCCVCGRVMGLHPENGLLFLSGINGDVRYLCHDCNRRYWTSQNDNDPVPA